MTRERWQEVAKEMQVHINALAEIAEREGMDQVNVCVHGVGSDLWYRSRAVYIDESHEHFIAKAWKNGRMEITGGTDVVVIEGGAKVGEIDT